MANGQRLVKPKITALLVIIELHFKTQMGYHVNYSYIKHDKDVVRKDLLHNMNWNVNECSYCGKCHKYPQKVKYKSRPNNLPPECYRPKK